MIQDIEALLLIRRRSLSVVRHCSRPRPALASFIEEQTSIFFGTANGEGQPYIQHRGPKGLLRVLNDKTIAFVDFAGNRQYITQGNLAENSKAHLFLIDYARRRRVKIWGTALLIKGCSSS